MSWDWREMEARQHRDQVERSLRNIADRVGEMADAELDRNIRNAPEEQEKDRQRLESHVAECFALVSDAKFFGLDAELESVVQKVFNCTLQKFLEKAATSMERSKAWTPPPGCDTAFDVLLSRPGLFPQTLLIGSFRAALAVGLEPALSRRKERLREITLRLSSRA